MFSFYFKMLQRFLLFYLMCQKTYIKNDIKATTMSFELVMKQFNTDASK